jgi:uncharacterized repeat protein (TIGR01451 family)
VPDILIGNAPRTPVPQQPSSSAATPTPAATSTPTLTPYPTLAPDDGASPYLYLTLSAQHDPMCKGVPQRYSIWVSNVGMTELTDVVLENTLPAGTLPVLNDSTAGAEWDGDRVVTWSVGDMMPGEAIKFDLGVEVPEWLEAGTWAVNVAAATAQEVPQVNNSIEVLVSDCDWLAETVAVQPLVIPTAEISPTATSEATTATSSQGGVDARGVTVDSPSVADTSRMFDASTGTTGSHRAPLLPVIAVALGVLVVVTGVLFYRQLTHR